jgi:CRP/FNR family transcriptional regulator, cyclic AMP receptor protein
MTRKASLNGVLAHVPLFSSCNAKELKSIARLTTGLHLAAGTVVTRQGAIGHHFAIITEGTANVAIDGRVVAGLGPGDFFGEISLLDGGPQTATITAETDIAVEIIGHGEFTQFLRESPSVTRNVLKGIATRLRAADAHIADATVMPASD